MRQFRDAAGVEWRVFQTERNAAAERRDHLLPPEYRHGWLVFESAKDKRRLAPVPPNWSELTDRALADLCATAAVQARQGKHDERPPLADVAVPRAEELTSSSEMEGAELRAVEERLAESINEVCDAPAVEKLDTGELIRVEESLVLAAEAAKEAVSLRQKKH